MDADCVIDSNVVVARYEAAKSFDLEDDLEYCSALSLDEVPLPSLRFLSSPAQALTLLSLGPIVLRRYNCQVNVLPQHHATLATVTIRYPFPAEYLHPPIAASPNYSPAHHD